MPDHPPEPRSLERWASLAVVAACALYLWFTFQPDLLFRNTTPNGGDTGAHVWWPAYLRDHILGDFRLTGWAPDWYAGFPAGHFYFPLPSLLVVIADLFMPYNVAFKLVSASGAVALPVGAYCLGRGLGVRFPGPALFAVATLPFLFYKGYQIWGGNLYSTLAGEFSFTIALALSLAFLGSFARALEERRGLAAPAALAAAVAMSHLIVTVFAIVAALFVLLLRRPVKNLGVAVAVGGVGALVTAIWSLPLVARLGYTTDMGWTKLKVTEDGTNVLLPHDLRWAFVLAIVGLVVGLALRRKPAVGLALTAAALVGGFFLAGAVEGRVWNARLLPFYYLCVFLLAACGAAEVARSVGWAAATVVGWIDRPEPDGELPPWGPAFAPDGELPALVPAVAPDGGLPRWDPVLGQAPDAPAEPLKTPSPPSPPSPPRSAVFAMVVPLVVAALAVPAAIAYTDDKDIKGNVPGWIKWNYSGYEAKPAYPEFAEVIQTMDELGPGRALWEPSSGIDKYGTTLALELLPHFTDGRVGSMEGLYFESSATTPYHFIIVSEVANQPSNPVRDLTYGTLADFDRGVRHMQLMGVRWYMAQSKEAKAKADAHPGLRFAAETGSPDTEPHVARWRVYEVSDSVLVEPLTHEPVVLSDVGPSEWLEPSADWLADPDALDRLLAADGPDRWERAPSGRARSIPEVPIGEATQVSSIESGDDWLRFRVSEPGVPVLVKVSYFPNWQADGAEGPWRVSPNLMVVVPTEREVSLSYGRTPVDWAGNGLTLVGLAGLVLLRRWRPAPLAARGGAGVALGDGAPPDPEALAPEGEGSLGCSSDALIGPQAYSDAQPTDHRT